MDGGGGLDDKKIKKVLKYPETKKNWPTTLPLGVEKKFIHKSFEMSWNEIKILNFFDPPPTTPPLEG